MRWLTGIGRWLNSAVARVIGLFHRSPPGDVERSVVSFGQRTRATVTSNGPWLLVSNLAWALGNAAVLLMAMRFSGLDSSTVPLATALLACGYLMVVNLLPIPGKSALAAPTLFTIMSLTTDADQSAMARRDPALPGGDLAPADAGGRVDVLRLALPGPPRHGHDRA